MSQKPTWKYIPGGRLTKDEYEDQARDFTQRELEKLRKTLQTNKVYRDVVERSPYRDTKVLANRFMAGNYWLPNPPPEEELEPKFSWFRFTLYIIIVTIFLAAGVYVSLHFAGIRVFDSNEL